MKIFPAGVHVKIGVAGLAGRIQAQLFMVVDLVTANCAGFFVAVWIVQKLLEVIYLKMPA